MIRHSLLFAWALSATTSPLVSQESIPFTGGRWELRGDSTAVIRRDGRDALRMHSGKATLRDVRLEDGTIDVDVLMSPRRSFVYLNFRVQDEQNLEEFYIRPHKSWLPDAIQYAPVFNGQSAWQLYHGAMGSAGPHIDTGVWTRLRVVLQGRRAAFFIGDTVTPVMVIQRLAREPKPGYVELRGFLPNGTPGTGAIVHFSNVRIRPGVVAYNFGAAAAEAPLPANVIQAWTLSKAFNVRDIAPTTLRPEWLAQPTAVEVEPNGMVAINRWLANPPRDTGLVDAATVARVRLVAESAGTRRLDLGFSDAVTVFLNGEPLFHRDDSYSFPNRRDGLIGFGQAVVYLPLRAGVNDLSILVTDHFGGSGLMGRLPDMKGVRVERMSP